MVKVNGKSASLALIIGHMAGMIDIAALPVWVGTMISGYRMNPTQAGAVATLFLGGVVLSSVLLSPLFHKMPGRWMPAAGFLGASLCFLAMTGMTSFGPLAVTHLIAGFCNGFAISFVHGTMARTWNPHRIFALGSLALGIFAVFFLGGAPAVIAQHGGPVLFVILGVVMAAGAVVTAAFFPAVTQPEDVMTEGVMAERTRFNRCVWLAILGIMCMALVQAMIFSFAERIGTDAGFTLPKVQFALAFSGTISILPSILASILEKRLPPIRVAIGGAFLQGVFAVILSQALDYPLYVAAMVVFPFIMIFTHTFVFGYLARIEPTGRANAATPAMIMTGSATGPLLGGVLVQSSGYGALGLAAVAIGLIAIAGFTASWRAA